MSKPYSVFANYYDYLMADVDYDAWTERIIQPMKTHHPRGRVLVDLACGTGNISNRLARKGYMVTGIDISEEMLMIAQDKAYEKNIKVQYLRQNMVQFKVHRKADLVTCICDGLNYLLTEEALMAFFQNAQGQLNEGGLLILDISTPYKYTNVLSKRTIAELDDQVSFIWENHYDEATQLLSFDIAFFVPESGTDFYRRTLEHHEQKAHSLEQIMKAAEPHFQLVEHQDGESGQMPHEQSERWLLVFKKV